MNTTEKPTRFRTHAAGLASMAVLALAVVGCSASDESASMGSGSADTASGSQALVEGTESAADAEMADSLAGADTASAEESAGRSGQLTANELVSQRAVISTGAIALEAEDVADARFEIQKILDRVGGQVSEETTDADREGELRRARIVVRVPADDFTETMSALEAVGSLQDSTVTSDDVTTQVIDTEVRIRAQEKSLERVEELLARATSIRDIVSIEAQLTRRQAELDSLKSQSTYLADQTSRSTITVNLERARDRSEPEPEVDEAGFLAGLESGWTALTALTVGALTGFGAVLPFLAVLLVLLVPVIAWNRRRRATAQPASTAG